METITKNRICLFFISSIFIQHSFSLEQLQLGYQKIIAESFFLEDDVGRTWQAKTARLAKNDLVW